MSPKDPPSSVLTNTSRSSSAVSELQATPSMAYHCFDVLISELHPRSSSHQASSAEISQLSVISQLVASDGATKKPDFVDELPPGERECPIFVTWDKKRHTYYHQHHHHQRYELRGCIGTHAPKPLAVSIGEYAKISALNDKRFHPVVLAEIPLLRVAVSLLIRYEPCEHCHDWTVGVHGIIIGWVDDGVVARGEREYSATYLPEVAADQGWDQVTAVESLIRKAGYHGRITPGLLKRIQCTRYQSSKVRATFDEYLEARGVTTADGGDTGPTISGLGTSALTPAAGASRRQPLGRVREPSPSLTSGCVVS